MELDLDLIAQARRFITGRNIHYVNSWLFCYEMSEAGSSRRRRYEELLREFVSWQNHLRAARANAEYVRNHSREVCSRTEAVDEASTRARLRISHNRF